MSFLKCLHPKSKSLAIISEKTNLAAKEPAKVKELPARLTKLLKERDAQMPTDKSTGKPVEWPDHPKDNHSK